ncbi:MAG: PTS sugar transporter subunit IIA [Planctomycetes bacterium]|nr:PTS sugar transporter subunit IIA [Planctomycetota bacterium]
MGKTRTQQSLWREELLACPLVADDALGALRELAARLGRADGVVDGAALLSAIEAREAEGPTFLGQGLALPHARTPAVASIVAAVGTSPRGIPWGPAGERAHLVFAVAAPSKEVRGYLDLVSRLTRAARKPGWTARLASSPDTATLAAALRESVGG